MQEGKKGIRGGARLSVRGRKMTYTNAEKMIKSAPDTNSAEALGVLLQKLGNPERGIKLIKIYGTSGKSSVCALLSAVLNAAGYKAGRLTTPVIHSVPESLCIYERPLSIDFFTKSADKVYRAVCDIKKEPREGEELSFGKHDLLFALALTAFYDADCDFAVIEVPNGNLSHIMLGDPIISVISTVSDTDSAKSICARLDRNSKEIVTAVQSREVHKLIFDKCAELNTRFSMPLKNSFAFMSATAKHIEFTYGGKMYVNGCGAYYQANNMMTVLEAVDALKRGGVKIEGTDICSAVLSEGIPLRFEIISVMPTIIVDRADTEEKRSALIESMKRLGNGSSPQPTVICEKDGATVTEEFLNADYSAKLSEVGVKELKKHLKSEFSTLTEENTVIIIGSSEYCEAAAKLTREILM